MLDTPSPEIQETVVPQVVRDPLYTPEAIAERKRLIRMGHADIQREILMTSADISLATHGVTEPDWNKVRALITRKAGYGLLLKMKEKAR